MATQIIGHRGYKSKYPENTCLSFERALQCGADGLELDVHYSKDGELVVYHDFSLEGLAGGSGNIFEHPLKALKELDITAHGYTEKIPTLAEVLQCIVKTNKHCHLNVELKAGSTLYPGIEAKVLELCSSYLPLEQLIFSSFDHDALAAFKQMDAKVQTGVLTTASLYEPWSYMKHFDADYYHPHYLALRPEKLKALLLNGVAVNTYTVNDVSVAESLIHAGVHGIITDSVEDMMALKERCLLET